MASEELLQEITEKSKKIKRFLSCLAYSFGHTVSLELHDEGTCYFGRTNTIFLSFNDVVELSVNDLCYIIAHEYKHSLLYKDKDLFIEHLWRFSVLAPFFAMVLLNTLSSFIFKESIYLLIFMLITSMFCIILIHNPFWYNRRVHKEELVCDDFANKVVGTGKEYWEKEINKSPSIKKFNIYMKVLSLGFYYPTHPSLETRLENASKFTPNKTFLELIS